MKVKIEEVLGETTLLHTEMMSSLTQEMIDIAIKNDYTYDVKLLINGIEAEPKFLELLLDNIVKHIENEGKQIVRNKLQEAEDEIEKLREILSFWLDVQ